jgi:hypothetical protein
MGKSYWERASTSRAYVWLGFRVARVRDLEREISRLAPKVRMSGCLRCRETFWHTRLCPFCLCGIDGAEAILTR